MSTDWSLDDGRIGRDLGRVVVNKVSWLGHHMVIRWEGTVVHLRLCVNRLRDTLPRRRPSMCLMRERLSFGTDGSPPLTAGDLIFP
jgi:hypothetical protein